MGPVLIIVTILIVVVVLVVVFGITIHNRLVKARNLVEQSWNQIDVELNRRYDLIPNLVNTIKGATDHEKSTLESVVALRNQAVGLAGSKADPAQRAAVEAQLSSQLQTLLQVTVEAYPQLQTNSNFVQLQTELANTEARIANARKYYNANVGNYNTAIESFPASIIAGMGHFIKADYFQIQDQAMRATPQVSFGTAPVVEAPAALPAAMDAPFQTPPAPADDYAQPNFTESSGWSDK
ncbi:MAG: LemA family protein [Propionibacteriaceae bacterium]|jgi:LemA protein|nr:LemA family protein [Propionibacteriaceae bacterium]